MAYQFASSPPTAYLTPALRLALIALCCLPSAAGALSARSSFFASPKACAASGRFKAQDCAAAFERAEDEIRSRAPSHNSKIECILRFHLCERRGGGYAPTLLGIEIIEGRGVPMVAPVLAVEGPVGQFSARPLAEPSGGARAGASKMELLGMAPIRPTGRFIPFALFKNTSGWAGGELREDSPGPESRHAQGGESAEERRQRLKAAPFIE